MKQLALTVVPGCEAEEKGWQAVDLPKEPWGAVVLELLPLHPDAPTKEVVIERSDLPTTGVRKIEIGAGLVAGEVRRGPK